MREQKGITLIALVITIIVLLILAGVTLAMLSGDNSIFKRSNEAAKSTEFATSREELGVAYNSAYAENAAKVHVDRAKTALTKEIDAALDAIITDNNSRNKHPITMAWVSRVSGTIDETATNTMTFSLTYDADGSVQYGKVVVSQTGSSTDPTSATQQAKFTWSPVCPEGTTEAASWTWTAPVG